MSEDTDFYKTKLYPFQDRIIKTIGNLKTGFYLSGGTALSRGYLNHRYSDDLDFFLNDLPDFPILLSRCLERLGSEQGINIRVLAKDERFARAVLSFNDLEMKIEWINDVPQRIGDLRNDSKLGLLDSPENILANKITAIIDRQEPKDFADIWGLCFIKKLKLADFIESAQSKAAGIFPADLSRVLCSVTEDHFQSIKWVNPPDAIRFQQDLVGLGERLLSAA